MGSSVDRSLIGTRVLGFSLWFETVRGTHSSLVALPIGNVVHAPNTLPSTQLTTVGLNGLTAWRGLADLKLARGESLVVTGATGGVGGFAVELAAARGFKVIGVEARSQPQDSPHALPNPRPELSCPQSRPELAETVGLIP